MCRCGWWWVRVSGCRWVRVCVWKVERGLSNSTEIYDSNVRQKPNLLRGHYSGLFCVEFVSQNDVFIRVLSINLGFWKYDSSEVFANFENMYPRLKVRQTHMLIDCRFLRCVVQKCTYASSRAPRVQFKKVWAHLSRAPFDPCLTADPIPRSIHALASMSIPYYTQSQAES